MREVSGSLHPFTCICLHGWVQCICNYPKSTAYRLYRPTLRKCACVIASIAACACIVAWIWSAVAPTDCLMIDGDNPLTHSARPQFTTSISHTSASTSPRPQSATGGRKLRGDGAWVFRCRHCGCVITCRYKYYECIIIISVRMHMYT